MLKVDEKTLHFNAKMSEGMVLTRCSRPLRRYWNRLKKAGEVG